MLANKGTTMTTPIRLSVKREGHLTLNVGDTLIEILAEGTLLVMAYEGRNSVPVLEYSGGTAPEPGPVFRLRPSQAVPAFTEPKPKPEPVIVPPPTVKARKTPKRVKLGHEAPRGHTAHGYVFARIKPLVAPRTPEGLAHRYAEYNAAMGTKHPIPGNLSLIDAFEHLKELVERWATAKTNKAKSKRALIQQELFNGNARVTGTK
jgi:hypothetical protein